MILYFKMNNLCKVFVDFCIFLEFASSLLAIIGPTILEIKAVSPLQELSLGTVNLQRNSVHFHHRDQDLN